MNIPLHVGSILKEVFLVGCYCYQQQQLKLSTDDVTLMFVGQNDVSVEPRAPMPRCIGSRYVLFVEM